MLETMQFVSPTLIRSCFEKSARLQFEREGSRVYLRFRLSQPCVRFGLVFSIWQCFGDGGFGVLPAFHLYRCISNKMLVGVISRFVE